VLTRIVVSLRQLFSLPSAPAAAQFSDFPSLLHSSALAMGDDFERAKSYLQVADANGVSLYDHVSALLLKLLKDKPDQQTGE
jgi:hypothetical protein